MIAGRRIEGEEESETRNDRRVTQGSCIKLVTQRAGDFFQPF